MTAKRGGTAHFDGTHHPELLKRQLVGFAISFAVLPENAGQLKGWPGHAYFFFGAIFAGRSSRSSGLMVAETS
jgi:hypothetical protein